jgi:hypothetical protein
MFPLSGLLSAERQRDPISTGLARIEDTGHPGLEV